MQSEMLWLRPRPGHWPSLYCCQNCIGCGLAANACVGCPGFPRNPTSATTPVVSDQKKQLGSFKALVVKFWNLGILSAKWYVIRPILLRTCAPFWKDSLTSRTIWKGGNCEMRDIWLRFEALCNPFVARVALSNFFVRTLRMWNNPWRLRACNNERIKRN